MALGMGDAAHYAVGKGGTAAEVTGLGRTLGLQEDVGVARGLPRAEDRVITGDSLRARPGGRVGAEAEETCNRTTRRQRRARREVA
jgi:hypothetical protein